MNPNRYWLLYFGILFVFLGSKRGQEVCRHVFNLFRTIFYLSLALIAGGLSMFFWALNALLQQFAVHKKVERKQS